MKKQTYPAYEAPVMTATLVEVENGLCSASVTDEEGKGVKVESAAQDYESFDASKDDIINWE